MSGSQAPQASIDDRGLLAAHVRGDPDAFAHLVSRHRDRLWEVAVRTLGDHEDAADALQDALISALRNAAGFRGDAAVTTWLHRIVVNACLDRIRRRKTRPTVPLGTHDVAAPSDATGQVDTRLAVRAALASLPAEQREALILVDLEDLAVADAAHLLGVPIGTVKSRCSRGRTALAQLLAGTLHGTDIAGPAVAVGGCSGKEAEQAGDTAVLKGEVHGSGEIKDCQQQSGEEIGQAATEALEPRTTLIHGRRDVTHGMRWVTERRRFIRMPFSHRGSDIRRVTGKLYGLNLLGMPKPSSFRRSGAKKVRSYDGPLRSGVSRPAMWRVLEIHKIIRAGRHPNCSTLAAEIEVTPKTIQRDISFMRDQLGLPLEYDAIKHGYFYTQEVHEFPMLQLSRHDLVALFLARHALEPLRGTRLERMLSESFSKIAEACPGEISIQWQELDDVFSVKAAGVLAADVTLFGDLLDAVRACREVSFDYRKLTSDKAERRTVRPHHVGQIEHGWYLIAFDPARGAMRTFALQRISNLAMLKTTFTREAGFNARDHLGGGFGVWSYAGDQRRSYEVHIRFEGYAARVVAERQWHPTQAIRKVKPDGSLIEFQADLSGLEEITRWVLSWGSKARVLGPPELMDRVAREVEGMRVA